MLNVSRSGYYDWIKRPISLRTQYNMILLARIKTIHAQFREAYGALKTWRYLNQQNITCGKHRIARLRREAGIEAKRKRRFRVTKLHYKVPQVSHDLVQRQFNIYQPNTVWVGDMTFIRTREGWAHLAVLLDLYSRRVIGWALGRRADVDLHSDALNMALYQRQPEPGLIHHTDRGIVYRASSYRQILREAQIQQSMGAKKSAYDNAVAESFFSNLKNEWVHHHDFKTREEAKLALFDYIECFYNTQRIHQSLNYLTPVEIEKRYYAQLK